MKNNFKDLATNFVLKYGVIVALLILIVVFFTYNEGVFHGRQSLRYPQGCFYTDHSGNWSNLFRRSKRYGCISWRCHRAGSYIVNCFDGYMADTMVLGDYHLFIGRCWNRFVQFLIDNEASYTRPTCHTWNTISCAGPADVDNKRRCRVQRYDKSMESHQRSHQRIHTKTILGAWTGFCIQNREFSRHTSACYCHAVCCSYSLVFFWILQDTVEPSMQSEVIWKQPDWQEYL